MLLLSALGLFATGCGSSGTPEGTIQGFALGVCGPSGPNYPVGPATVVVLKDRQPVKTVPVTLGYWYHFEVASGSYEVQFGHVRSPMVPGPGRHVIVRPGKAARADLSPQCP